MRPIELILTMAVDLAIGASHSTRSKGFALKRLSADDLRSALPLDGETHSARLL